MIKSIILLSIIISITSNYNCIKNKKHIDPKTNDQIVKHQDIAIHYKTEKFDIAIFPKEYSETPHIKRFTPTYFDINKAELALATQLKEINLNRLNQSLIIDENLNKYKRQYFGLIDSNGKKYLLINCFCSDQTEDNRWLNEYIAVCDGGSCYWKVKYYIEDNKLTELVINSLA